MKTKIQIIALGFILGMALTIGSFYTGKLFTGSGSIKVPDFVTQEVSEVNAWITTNKLTNVTIEEEYSETVESGIVISQSVEAGTVIGRNDKITIVVSAGYDPTVEVRMIDFSGMDIGQIQEWIAENHLLNTTIAFEKSTSVLASYFLRSVPNSNIVKRSDEVTFYISTGSKDELEKVTVPDMVNGSFSKADVTAWANENGIKVTFKTDYSDSVTTGNVMTQSIAANEEVWSGSSMEVTISEGKIITIADLTNKTKSYVDAYVQENQLNVQYKTRYDASVTADMVISTSPAAGTQVVPGATIAVTLSLGNEIAIPDTWLKATMDDFEAWINTQNSLGAGIKLVTTPVPTDNENQVGYVASYDKQSLAVNGTITVSYYVLADND